MGGVTSLDRPSRRSSRPAPPLMFILLSSLSELSSAGLQAVFLPSSVSNAPLALPPCEQEWAPVLLSPQDACLWELNKRRARQSVAMD